MLTDDDLVFITNGGCVENSTLGSQNTPRRPPHAKSKKAAAGICGGASRRRTPAFGHPDKFCFDPEQSNWMSATVTTLDDQHSLPISRAYLQARSLQRRRSHRRHRNREGLQLAA